jgi:hypothetical protein
MMMTTSRVHAVSASLATLTVATFWTSTVVSELFLGADAVVLVKHCIALYGLVPMTLFMILAGATGNALAKAKNRTGRMLDAKAKRMSVLRLNGLLLMVPLALFLNWKAGSQDFDTTFYVAQAVELLVGLLQLSMLLSNFSSGLLLSGRLRSRRGS